MRYSVIIPAYNGIQYLPACLNSILSQPQEDFELIVSDDHSTDGTMGYLATLADPRLKVFQPPHSMSMAEHWEWALTKASGEWLIFVGQDDGLQPYFFELADRLTRVGEEKHLRVIMSERAYYFWPGCEETYGMIAVRFRSVAKLETRSFKKVIDQCLLGKGTYFDLPAMYTTSLVHRTVLEEAKDWQGGVLFRTHPQDANLVAVFSRLEKKYLWSGIPLGWVGSSPKSAGLAVTSAQTSEQDSLKEDYLAKITRSALRYNPRIGEFSFGSCTLYLWGALLETEDFRRGRKGVSYASNRVARRVFQGVMREMSRSPKWGNGVSGEPFGQILTMNNLDRRRLEKSLARRDFWDHFREGVNQRIQWVWSRIKNKFFGHITYVPATDLAVDWRDEPTMSMASASLLARKAATEGLEFGPFRSGPSNRLFGWLGRRSLQKSE